METSLSNSTHLKRSKRGPFNFGGSENNPDVRGSNNIVHIGLDPRRIGEETLVRKIGQETGRLVESTVDIAAAPSRWLTHMQDNWLTYLVCITILAVSTLTLYICIRQKISITQSGTTELLKRVDNLASTVDSCYGRPRILPKFDRQPSLVQI